jgi:hypothetical protein
MKNQNNLKLNNNKLWEEQKKQCQISKQKDSPKFKIKPNQQPKKTQN